MLVGAVAVVTDVPGRWLSGVLGVGLIVFATMTWRARPKLAVTPGGLVLRGWFGTRTLTRADLTVVRITEFRRIGRRQRLLELETADDQLRIFTRWDLGTDPIKVLDALTAAGYSAPKKPPR